MSTWEFKGGNGTLIHRLIWHSADGIKWTIEAEVPSHADLEPGAKMISAMQQLEKVVLV